MTTTILKVEFDKYMLSGIAEGLTLTETMRFVDWDSAYNWALDVTYNPNVNYVILELRNPTTGQTVNF